MLDTKTDQAGGDPVSGRSASGEIFAAALTTTAEALAITDQQDLWLDLVPTLSQTQALARSHATAWLHAYAQALLQGLTSFQAYAAVIQSFAPQLVALANTLAGGDTSARPQLLTGFERLEQLATIQLTNTQNGSSTVNAFLTLISDDATRYETDAKTIAGRYTGPQGELEQLQEQLGTLSLRLADDNQKVADGAIQALPGALIAGLGLGAAYVDTSVGKVLLEKGLKMAYGAVEEVDAAMQDAVAAIKEYTETVVQLQSERLEVAAFETVRQHVSRLHDMVSGASDALEEASSAWQDEQRRLQLWTATAEGSSPTTLATDIQASADAWSALSATVGTYLTALQSLPEVSSTTTTMLAG